jgi:hypothetical protein
LGRAMLPPLAPPLSICARMKIIIQKENGNRQISEPIARKWNQGPLLTPWLTTLLHHNFFSTSS